LHVVKKVLRHLVTVLAWLFLTFACSLAVALAYEPLRLFGATLYVIVGTLLLGALGLWRLWRSAPRIALFATAIVLVGGATLVTATSVSPAGKYAIGGCRGGLYEYTEDEYYELSGGVYYYVVGGRRQRMGSYYKKNGQWILQIDRRDGQLDEQKLRFSLLGFDTVIPPMGNNSGGPTTFERRRLIPFTRPPWIPEWLE
jgi:energy-coupling factor transporter transmembrane protein EcfT